MKSEARPFFEHRVITRQDGKPYLIRWALNLPWFTVKLHKIVASDDSCMHDHPWKYMSLILWGGYIEQTPARPDIVHARRENSHFAAANFVATHDGDAVVSRDIRPLSVVRRPGDHVHRLMLYRRLDGSEKPCWTLFITGKRLHTWGFYTLSGWIRWKFYDSKRDC